VIGLPGTVRHDVPVRGSSRFLLLLCCAVALAGCSALSGRTSTESRRPGAPASASAAAAKAARAAFTDKRTVAAVLKAAQHDFEVVFTYDYRHLARYRNTGESATTGAYATTYRNALEGKGAQAITAQKYVQVATATIAGLVGLSGDKTHATTVVSGTISATSVKNPAGGTKTVTLTLKLQHVDGSWRIAGTGTGAAARGSIPANGPMRKAMAAARAAVLRIYGLRRASFKKDYAKALALTTDTLHATMSDKEASVQKTLTGGKYDLSAKIVGFAALEPNPDVRFVVTLDEYHVGRQGTQLGPFRHTLAVGVSYVDKGWRVSSATPVS
jgi:hypothetical protein